MESKEVQCDDSFFSPLSRQEHFKRCFVKIEIKEGKQVFILGKLLRKYASIKDKSYSIDHNYLVILLVSLTVVQNIVLREIIPFVFLKRHGISRGIQKLETYGEEDIVEILIECADLRYHVHE